MFMMARVSVSGTAHSPSVCRKSWEMQSEAWDQSKSILWRGVLWRVKSSMSRRAMKIGVSVERFLRKPSWVVRRAGSTMGWRRLCRREAYNVQVELRRLMGR